MRIILNGKKAGLESVRSAIRHAREEGPLEVRVTWESGDIERLVGEALAEGCSRLVVGGGDGSVKEITDALMKYPAERRPELAILPLGTANDFATACGITADPVGALKLARQGEVHWIDVVSANNEYFINVASGGFGAQVTANTPVGLKNFLGGGAYTLAGVVQALGFEPYDGKVRMPDEVVLGKMVIGAVCNGRQAGGGQQLAPDARINDGFLEVVGLLDFPPSHTRQVLEELRDREVSGTYVKRFKVPWVEWESEVEMPINLDGEPIKSTKIRFEVQPKALRLVLPTPCPMID
ncbi:lipid kinase YegS [Haloferula chungangensis]|uniref:Lipid kinase YegS n=1 Tax=Haloferula chungangensis TaxID=1048331 RepID=A0ABW2L6W1_9BACT